MSNIWISVCLYDLLRRLPARLIVLRLQNTELIECLICNYILVLVLVLVLAIYPYDTRMNEDE